MNQVSASTDPLAAILVWIEQRLDDPLTLDDIASQARLSPYHFSRLFTARMGRSVIAHIRGRRLIKAARRLIEEPELKLVDLAFDCGFESQEPFTRAFKRLFGVSPGRFRRGFAVTPLEGQFPMTMPDTALAAVEQLPDLVTLDAFTLAGPSRRFDDATKSDIPQLWSQLIGKLPFDGQVDSWDSYGLVWRADRASGSFNYMAGVKVQDGATPPAGFDRQHLPRTTYAVFRITLTGAALHPQVKAALAKIWCELIPASGLEIADGPDFEYMDGDFAPNRPGALIDFYVPVRA